MYTQCPECEAAFRVTAEVLKQAAGMVRCGSCGHAFNSLAYLSEKKPEPKIPDPSIPELVPEPSSESPPTPPEPSPGPQSISAEQSAALLKTLDQLAGEDIRIEDTGVEWRVLDEKDVDDEPLADSNEQDILSDPEVTSAFRTEDEPQEATSPDLRHTDVFEPAATMVDEQGLFDDGNTQVDELLDEAPTPVDEFLSAEPADGAAAEAVDLDLGALLDDLESDDDHDIQAELDALPETPAVSEPVSVEESANTGDDDDPAPVDEATDSEPEWSADAVEYSDSETAQDFDDMPADEAAHVVEESAEPEAVEPVLRFDDNTPLPEDFLDEAVPVAAAPVDAVPAIDGPDPEALQKDIELGKADEWQALLDEFGDLLATDLDANDEQGEQKADDDWGELSEEAVDAELSRELDSLEADAGEEDADEPETHDSVTDEAIELETLDENQSDEADDHPHEAADDLIEAEAETDEPADNIIEAVTDEPANNVIEVEAKTDESIDDEQPVAEAIAEASLDEDQPAADDHVDDEQSQDEISDEAAADIEASELDIAAELYDGEPLPVDDDGGLDLTGILDPDDDGLEDHGEVDANPDDQGMPEIIELGDEPEEQPVDAPGPGHPHYVPPPSEEEQTINMLIDQDLLAIAHEDDEGFTSTIVFEQGAEPTDVDSIIMGGDDDDQPANDDVPEDDEMLAEAGEQTDEAMAAPDVAPAQIAEKSASQNLGRTAGLGALAAVLVLALGAQSVHQKREQLATDPRFGSAVQSIYSALGMPVTPEWDVSGWRIEKAQGLTDDSGRLLTIFAQVGNQADQPLPYPVITVSITDRYQESLGSVVVDPVDYLANRGTAAGTVSGGDSFEATIPIAELSPNAEGYQLNACYRQPSGPLRCVKQDFR